MSPAQREAFIEESARSSVAEETDAMRAADACERANDAEALNCLLANGFSRARDVLALYRDEQAKQRAFLRQAERVATRGDARSLLAAAHILPFAEVSAWSRDDSLERRPAALEWIVRAQQLGRDDPVVQWGVATYREFGGEPTERMRIARAASVRRLLALDPGNAAVHLLALGMAPETRTPLDAKAFMRLAALPHYRTRVPEIAAVMLDAFRDMPPDPAFRSAALLIDPEHVTATQCAPDADIMLSAQLLTAITVVTDGLPIVPYASCAKEAIASAAELRDECLRFFARLHASSRTVSERNIAAAIARRAAISDAEKSHWQEVYKRQRWQTEQAGHASGRLNPYVQARAIAAGWRSGDELLGIETLLRASRIPLEPPREWKIPGEPPD